jgi:hypothetical protein
MLFFLFIRTIVPRELLQMTIDIKKERFFLILIKNDLNN